MCVCANQISRVHAEINKYAQEGIFSRVLGRGKSDHFVRAGACEMLQMRMRFKPVELTLELLTAHGSIRSVRL